MKKKLLPLIMLGLTATQAHSCIRVDLDDRPPEEVLKKAYDLGATQKKLFTEVTGAIKCVNNEVASAIALDRRTLLTAAHIKGLRAGPLEFRLATDVQHKDKSYTYTVTSQPIFHPDFRFEEQKCAVIRIATDSTTINGIPISEAGNYTFDQFNNSSLLTGRAFSGVDLAILKLDKPLPKHLAFPKILSLDEHIENTKAVATGYGPMKYNHQETGPIPAPLKACRHLISTRVNAHERADAHVLHGNYKGLFINGDESFIPNKDMLKTEGLPVGGDSGGPLLIDSGNQTFLAGIFSGANSLNCNFIEDQTLRVRLAALEQPVFPVWTDVRHYKEWILENMQNKK